MLIKQWDELPEFMRNEEVRPYYEALQRKKISLLLKRFFDIILSLILLLLLSPFLFILIVIIKCDSKGSAFYRQERITQNGKLFKIIKFRTMITDADKLGALVTSQNDKRITKVGSKIRKLRLDEIPQLINVLSGDMSFVGTRPEVKKYVEYYTNEMMATLLLPAGVTSEVSLKFKDEDVLLESYLEKNPEKDIDSAYHDELLPMKMDYNLNYIKQFTLIKDIKICFSTLIGVLK